MNPDAGERAALLMAAAWLLVMPGADRGVLVALQRLMADQRRERLPPAASLRFLAERLARGRPEPASEPVRGAGWITTRAAAVLLGVSERRVRAMAQAGRLSAHHDGRKWLLDESDVLARAGRYTAPARSDEPAQ